MHPWKLFERVDSIVAANMRPERVKQVAEFATAVAAAGLLVRGIKGAHDIWREHQAITGSSALPDQMPETDTTAVASPEDPTQAPQ